MSVNFCVDERLCIACITYTSECYEKAEVLSLFIYLFPPTFLSVPYSLSYGFGYLMAEADSNFQRKGFFVVILPEIGQISTHLVQYKC